MGITLAKALLITIILFQILVASIMGTQMYGNRVFCTSDEYDGDAVERLQCINTLDRQIFIMMFIIDLGFGLILAFFYAGALELKRHG